MARWISQNSDFLQIIDCRREIGEEKSGEKSKKNQKQTRNGWFSVFDPLASYIPFAFLCEACLTEVVAYLELVANDVLK